MLIACNEQAKPVRSLFCAPIAWDCVNKTFFFLINEGLVNMARDVNAGK